MLKYDMLEQAKQHVWIFVERPNAAGICSSKSQLSVSIGLYAQTACLENQVDCSKVKFHKICRGRLAMYQIGTRDGCCSRYCRMHDPCGDLWLLLASQYLSYALFPVNFCCLSIEASLPRVTIDCIEANRVSDVSTTT